jgi:hypothetical protein
VIVVELPETMGFASATTLMVTAGAWRWHEANASIDPAIRTSNFQVASLTLDATLAAPYCRALG